MKTIKLLFSSLLMAILVQGQVIHVPADYSTIQEGINAAMPGDTVLVAEGTYYEQINFKGKKQLTVASLFMKDGNTSHITNTIIDGNKLIKNDSASVVYLISGEDTTSILCGFTIQGGKGTFYKSLYFAGGGIFIANSGGTIRNNIIVNNSLDDQNIPRCYGAAGGGIFIDNRCASNETWCIIENNEISFNTVNTSNTYCGGGGLLVWGNVLIKNNTVQENSCMQKTSDSKASLFGGGLGYGSNAYPVTELLLIGNTFKNNSVSGINGAGAGACIDYGRVTCVGNEFSGNEILNSSYHPGGGILCEVLAEGSCFSNNTFSDNKATGQGGGLALNLNYNSPGVMVENNYFIDNVAGMGGALSALEVPVILQNNVFSGNHAINYGGAVYFDKSYFSHINNFATLLNNSFFGNSATNYGGAIFTKGVSPLIINSIFWGDHSNHGQEIYVYPNNKVEIAYSTINPSGILGCVYDGGNNLNQDPMFDDTVRLTLSEYSNCIEKGTTEYTCECGFMLNCPLYDIAGLSRISGKYVDMGAYEFLYVKLDAIPFRNKNSGITSYPNPFSGSTTFAFKLEESTQVNLHIFNEYGQLVAEPLDKYQPTGEHTLIWKAEGLPVGIYTCRLQSGEKTEPLKIIKIK